jgi:hypothetical protein
MKRIRGLPSGQTVNQDTDRSHDRIWFVRRGGQVKGPFPSGKLRRLLDDGILQPEDEVSDDRKAWRPVTSVPEVLPLRFRHALGDEAAGIAAERRTDRRKALVALVVVAVVIGTAVTAALRFRSPVAQTAAGCVATPGPGANLARCALDGLSAPGGDLTGAILNNASLAGARLDRARLGGADLRYANLAAAKLGYARLAGAKLVGGNLRAADLAYADLKGADLSHADLTGATLGGAELGGARLDSAIWVDGRRCARESVGGCVPVPGGAPSVK